MGEIAIKDVSNASRRSVKWSLWTEFFAKIATPLSTAILARILVPEIFGITAAVSIIVTFCEAITDTGFAKFIVQHDFKDDDEYKKSISVSIIFSLLLSAVLFILIYIFRFEIAKFVGCPGYESVLVVSCLQLPFFSLNSVFIAHLRRIFKFDRVFFSRLIYCATPFIFTVPLAILNFGPWSLVIGAIAAQLLQVPYLLVLCRKIIKPHFSLKLLGKIFKWSYLMTIESVIIWMSTWIITFISIQFFSTHIVGIVKVANSTVTNIFALFANSFTSVLFSTLSRLKNNDKETKENFYNIQSCAFNILIPLGLGCFFYSSVIVKVFLGNQWLEAANIIGILALSFSLRICFSNFVSEVFRANGHFMSSIIYHIFALAINIALKFAIGKYSLDMFAWSTVFTYLIMTIVSIIILRFRYGFSLLKQFKSLIPSVICSLFMVPALLLQVSDSYIFIQSLSQVVLCVACYVAGGLMLYKPLFMNTFSYLGFDKLSFRRK